MGDAQLHPLVQYGDAILEGPSDIRRLYNKNYINDLLLKVDDESLRVRVMQDITSARTQGELERAYQVHSERIWTKLHLVAREPSLDPGDVFEQIVYDRKHYNDGLKEREMSTETKKEETKAPKAPKYAPEANIEMQADKEGNAYGPENNPKRAGSKAAARFEHYGNGCTVQAFLDAGGSSADLDNDVAKGFIKISD